MMTTIERIALWGAILAIALLGVMHYKRYVSGTLLRLQEMTIIYDEYR